MMTRIVSFLVALLLAVSPMHAQAGGSNPFVGNWKLIGADKILPGGTRVPDYGAEPHGMAIFTADGHMMIEIFRDVRVKFASNDRAKGTLEEYRDVSLSSSCSFGTYRVDAATNRVTMTIDRSTYPNNDDSTQVRTYELKGDVLSWKVPARPDGSVPVTVMRRIVAQ
jgi:hypothetical protein